MRILVTPVWLVVALAGCGGSQSQSRSPEPDAKHTESMRIVCNVDALAKLDADADPIGIEGARWDYLIEHVDHPDVIEMLTLMRAEGDAQRVARLREQAERACLDSCALADSYGGRDS